MVDKISEMILEVINTEVLEPMETSEIERKVKEKFNDPDFITRAKVISRLKELSIKGLINGKKLGFRRGTWVWWKLGENPV